MRTIAILPIKRFSAAKQRMSELLTGGSRQALAQAMFCDVLAALQRVEGLAAVAVVTGDAMAESAAMGGRVRLVRDTVEAGQSHAAALGIRQAIEDGFERVLLVPGDTPLLDPREVEQLLEAGTREHASVLVVPDRHGSGTNALLLAPPDAIEPSFGPGSLERHLVGAKAAGLTPRVHALETLAHDVDTPEDLAAIVGLLEERRGAARTRGTLRQLERMRATRPPEPVVLAGPV